MTDDNYDGPSPAAVTFTAPNNEEVSFDIFEYPDDMSGQRSFQLAVFIKPAGQNWQAGRTYFAIQMYQPGIVFIPGEGSQTLNFLDLIAKYSGRWAEVVAKCVVDANAWMAARYGTGGQPNPDDVTATIARQAIATEIYGYKPGADRISVVPK